MEINYLEILFRKYVDNSIHLLEIGESSLDDICKRNSIDINSGSRNIEKELTNKLRDLITSEENLDRSKLRQLQEHLLLRYLVDKQTLNPYFRIIEVINDRLENGIYIIDISNEDIWKCIIITAIDIINIRNDKFNLDRVLRTFIEKYNTAYCANFLKNNGYLLKVSNNKIYIEDNEAKKVEDEIKKLVINLGGINLAKSVFEKIAPFFNNRQQRYNLLRDVTFSQKNKDLLKIQIPYGYLLQISMGNFIFVNHNDKSKYKLQLEKLIELVSCYVGIFGFQKYSIYSYMFLGVEDLAVYTFENLYYDKLFTIRQWNPEYIQVLSYEFFYRLFEENKNLEKILGFSLEEYIEVEKLFLVRGINDNFKVVKKKEIYDKLSNFKTKNIDRIIDLISHNRKSINKDSVSLNCLVNFNEKPLIKLKSDKYMLINPSWCSYAFVEVLESNCRKILGEIVDSKYIGYEIERFIKLQLELKGMKYKYGFYDGEQECDLVLENDKRIMFIEIKKKSFTNKAQSGDDVKLFDDISKSLLSSQKQLGRHEIKLLKDKEIILKKHRGKRKYSMEKYEKICWNDRIIERVSLSLHDFGFLNSRHSVATMLELLTISEVRTYDLNKDKKLDDMRKLIDDLRKQSEELYRLTGNKKGLREIYFDTSFISLQQFMIVLSDSKDTSELVEGLLADKYMYTGTSNFYADYDYMKKLSNTKS